MHPLIKNSRQNGILKYIRVLLSISIVISTFNPMIIASAASADTIFISSDKVNLSDIAHVVIFIDNCVNVTGMNLTLSYDSGIISLENVSANGSYVSGHVVSYVDNSGTVGIELRQLENFTEASLVPVIDLSFYALASGNSDLYLQDVELLEGEVSSSPANSIDGYILVEETTASNTAPVFSPIGDKFVNASEELSFNLNATDSDNDSLEYSMSGLPSAAILDPSSGAFSWTPVYNDNGTHSVEFNVTDGHVNVSETITITVVDVPAAVNQAPVLETIGDRTINETDILTIILNATDLDGNDLSYSRNASFGTLVDNVFRWDTGYDDAGIYDVMFTVSDGNATDSETITITVINANQAPVLETIGDRTINETDILTIILNATDLDGNDLSYSRNASFGTLADNVFSWDTGYDDAGIYDVMFTVSDGNATDSETITITVINANQAPVLETIGDRTINETDILTIILNATDLDGNDLSYSRNASFGTLVGNVFSWDTGYDDAGIYDVMFTVSDGNATDSETITITVINANQAPVLETIGDRTINETDILTIILNATDLDGNDLSYSRNASFGTLVGNVFSWDTGYDDAGIYDVMFTVSDGNATDSETITITVINANQAPVLETIGDRTINETDILTIILNATDLDGNDLSYSRNASFGTLADNVFSWDTGYDDAGIYDVMFTVSDGNATDSETITITVINANQAPVLETIGDRTINETDILTIILNATDLDGNDLSYSRNASFGTLAGNVFSWDTGYDDAGIYDVMFTVSDGNATDSETITVTVNNVNRKPVLTDITSQTVNEGSTLEFTLSAFDLDDNDLDYQMSGLPSGATLNATTGVFSWTPDYDKEGEYTVQFVVSDGEDTDFQYVAITVHNTNRAPEFPSFGIVNASEGSELVLDISAVDFDNNSLIYSTTATLGTLDSIAGEFVWTPDFDEDGTYYVEFTVSDGYMTDTEVVTIVVANTNRAPSMNPISPYYIRNVGDIISFNLVATDPDGNSITYNVSGLPASADSSLDKTTGSFTWTPIDGDEGIYSVEFTAFDGELSASVETVFAIDVLNTPPSLEYIGPKEVNEGQDLLFVLNGSSDDDDEITYYASGLPTGSTFDNISGTFNWTPSYDQSGNYRVTFGVTDGTFSIPETVTITVFNVNRAPSFDMDTSYIVNENEALNILLNATDLDDGDTLTFQSNVSYGSISGNVFTWTPGYTANQTSNGTYYINFTVTDNGGFSDNIIVTVIVNDVNAPPVLSVIGSKSVKETNELVINLTATDIDGDSLIYSLLNKPANATMGSSTGVFSWTPVKGEAGTYSVIFGVSDGQYNDTETVLITVISSSATSSPSSSSGSSGGGGGSGSTGEKYENILLKDYVIKSVVKDTDTVFTFYGGNNSIVSLGFTSKLNGGQVKSVVEMLKGTSSQVRSDAPGIVYKNMNIYIDSNLASDVIGNAKINFKVERSWVYDNEIDISTITLCRYSSGWVQLPTSVKGEDEYYFYFTSTTPGFSSFAISSVIPSAVEQIDEGSVSGLENTDPVMSMDDPLPGEPITQTTQESKTGFPFMLIIGLIGLMVIGIFGYRNKDYYKKVRMQLGNPDGKRYRRIK